MKKTKILFTMALIFLVNINLYSQANEDDFYELNYKETVTNVGTAAASFLEIGVGAKSLALGGAFTALANDASALYWNPAGITQLDKISITFNNTKWLAGTEHKYFAFVMPFGRMGAGGLSLNLLDYVDKQPVRTILMPEGTGEYYSAFDMALSGTYAAKITDNFSFGITSKYILQKVWHESASSMALDVGVLYKTNIEGFNIGTSISNFGSDMSLDGRDIRRAFDADENNYSNDRLNVLLETDSFPLPLLFRFGLSYSFTLMNVHNIIMSADLNHPSNNVETLNVGFEYNFMKYIIMRAGYQSLFDDYRENGLTLGFGIAAPLKNNLGMNLNYAYSSWGLLGYVQRFSFDIEF